MATITTQESASRRRRSVIDGAVGALRRHRVDAGIALALFVVAVLVISWFRREPVYSDDLGYWERWPRRAQSSGMANPYRMTMALSAEIARWIFGHSMVAYNAVGIAYGAALIAMLFVLVRLLMPRVVALGGALLLLTSPVFLEDASVLTPDWPAVFWFTGAFTLLVYAATRLEHRPRQAMLLAAAAGACIHFGLFARESAILLVLVVPLGMLVLTPWRHAFRLTATAGASAIAFFLAELFWFWRLFDDPLRRIDRILGGHVARRTSERLGGRVESAAVQAAESGTDEFTRTTLADWWGLADRYIDPISFTLTGRWTLALIPIALAVILVSRDRRAWFIATAAIIGVIGSVFLVGSINPLRPMLSMKFRYLALGWAYLMPMIAVGAWFGGVHLRRLLESNRTHTGRVARIVRAMPHIVLAAALVVPIALGPFDAARRPVFVATGSDGLRQVERAIERLESEGVEITRIVADGRTQQGLRIQLEGASSPRLRGATSNFNAIEPGDLVVVNRKRIAEPQARRPDDAVPEWLLIPPGNWRHLADSEFADFFVYHVGVPSGAPHEPLSRSGDDVTLLSRATPIDADHGQFSWQLGTHGLFVWVEDMDAARFTLGRGRHDRAAIEGDDLRLSIDTPGRLGVRVELHTGRGVWLSHMFLRTYDAEGRIRQESRMYLVEQDDRTSLPEFAIDPDSLRPWSFATSVQVDPDEDVSYRLYGVFGGTGPLTVDRVASKVIPTVE